MLSGREELIRQEVEEGTGAEIGLKLDRTSLQAGIRIWFEDLDENHSPVLMLRPHGLHRYRAELGFGRFAGLTVKQMQRADHEEQLLARALVQSVASAGATVRFSDQQVIENWRITGPQFWIAVEKGGLSDRFGEDVLVSVCRELVIPIMAAMAELYGYDPVPDDDNDDKIMPMEGLVSLSIVKRRERNPRNRLLCLRLHGPQCGVCGDDPTKTYGEAGAILEVHHIQPLALLDEAMAYDPARDLILLCPNCHRAIHRRRPIPYSPGELKQVMGLL